MESRVAPKPSGPHTAGAIQLGVGFRYGALLSDGDLNPWGSGLGLNVGYTLPQAIYFGGNFEYFFGESSALGAGVTAKTNLWQLSAEGGYDIGAGDNFVIRPKIGVGVASVKAGYDGCPGGPACETMTKTKPLIAPGVTFMLFTKHVSLSLDMRYAHVMTDPTGQGLIFSVGIGF